MSRDAQKQAKTTFGESQDVYHDASGKSNALYNKLFPIYEGEATHPQGFDPKDLAAMNTAAQQSTGGALSSVVGEGNLTAARDRNAGGFEGAVDESARDAMRTNSQRAVEIQGDDAKMREMNRQAGIQGLGSLYGTNTGEVLSSLGLGNQSTNTLTEAGKSGWFQNMTDFINASSNAAKAAAGFKPA